jgi:ribonuclease T1
MTNTRFARFVGIALVISFLLFGLSSLFLFTGKTEAPPSAGAVTEAPPAIEAITEKAATDTPSAAETVSVQQLLPEAQQTLVLIYQSGPFPYSRDGIVFGNREKQLPLKTPGYYREYTVPTPGAKDRGARRIVCGGEKPSAPDECYYTADHYQSFQLIRNETAQP